MAQLSHKDISSLFHLRQRGPVWSKHLWIRTELGACFLLSSLVQAIFTVCSHPYGWFWTPKNVLEDLFLNAKAFRYLPEAEERKNWEGEILQGGPVVPSNALGHSPQSVTFWSHNSTWHLLALSVTGSFWHPKDSIFMLWTSYRDRWCHHPDVTEGETESQRS